MKLDYDCLRAVLLDLEELLQFEIDEERGLGFPCLTLADVCEGVNLDQYGEAEVFYALHNLEEAGYISADFQFAGNYLCECMVTDITYEGHMFLKSIRDNRIWSQVKSLVAKAGSVSVPVLLELAKDVALRAIGS